MLDFFTRLFAVATGFAVILTCTIDGRVTAAETAVNSDATRSAHVDTVGDRVALTSKLTAAEGTIRVVCRLPAQWPQKSRCTLFHAGEVPHTHATLFMTETGDVVAVYKADVDHYAAIRDARTRRWTPGSLHKLEFAWRSDGDEVRFHLRLDDALVGFQTGRLILDWPKSGTIGARGNGQPWTGQIVSCDLTPKYVAPPELQPGHHTITVDTDTTLGPFRRFWIVSNFTSQHMFANPAYRSAVRKQSPHARIANCVRLLGGRTDELNKWLRSIRPDGSLECDFSGMITYLRGIQQAGLMPWIVLDNVPTALSQAGSPDTYGNTKPARNLTQWHDYVTQAVQAMVDAFGIDTVAGWQFRVGTEPDLYPGHWSGTKDEYLKHYDCTVDAVTRVIPNVRIGPGNILNPARDLMQAKGHVQWGLDIIDHCATGTNTWTGQSGTRLCFFGCSWYGAVGRTHTELQVAIDRLRERLNRYPQFRDIPISIAEFGILNDEYGRRLWSGDATQWGASWYAAVADIVLKNDIEYVHEWAQTTSGIRHPRTLVIDFLDRMADGVRLKRVSQVPASDANRCSVIAGRRDGGFDLLVYNHRVWREPEVADEVTVVLTGQSLTRDAKWQLSEWTIDRDHGVFINEFYRDCEKADLKLLPDAPLYGGNVAKRFGSGVHRILAQHREKYERLAKPGLIRENERIRVVDERLTYHVPLPGHAVHYIRIEPVRETPTPSSSPEGDDN